MRRLRVISGVGGRKDNVKERKGTWEGRGTCSMGKVTGV